MHLITECLWMAVVSASFSLLLGYCFRDNGIFENWLIWLAKGWYYKNEPEKLTEFLSLDQDDIEHKGFLDLRDIILENCDWFWLKPLGYCVTCMNVWITLALNIPFMLLIVDVTLFWEPFYIIFVTISLSYVITKYLDNKI